MDVSATFLLRPQLHADWIFFLRKSIRKRLETYFVMFYACFFCFSGDFPMNEKMSFWLLLSLRYKLLFLDEYIYIQKFLHTVVRKQRQNAISIKCRRVAIHSHHKAIKYWYPPSLLQGNHLVHDEWRLQEKREQKTERKNCDSCTKWQVV